MKIRNKKEIENLESVRIGGEIKLKKKWREKIGIKKMDLGGIWVNWLGELWIDLKKEKNKVMMKKEMIVKIEIIMKRNIDRMYDRKKKESRKR